LLGLLGETSDGLISRYGSDVDWGVLSGNWRRLRR
jgi:hypothetical protein